MSSYIYLCVNFPSSTGALLQRNQPLVPCYPLHMIAPKHLDNEKMCAVFFDLSGVFDFVPHGPLLTKCSQIGIDPIIVRWIRNYLSFRSQSVVLDGAELSPLPVVSGVTQGSVLGPMLFLVYIDQTANSVSN